MVWRHEHVTNMDEADVSMSNTTFIFSILLKSKIKQYFNMAFRRNMRLLTSQARHHSRRRPLRKCRNNKSVCAQMFNLADLCLCSHGNASAQLHWLKDNPWRRWLLSTVGNSQKAYSLRLPITGNHTLATAVLIIWNSQPMFKCPTTNTDSPSAQSLQSLPEPDLLMQLDFGAGRIYTSWPYTRQLSFSILQSTARKWAVVSMNGRIPITKHIHCNAVALCYAVWAVQCSNYKEWFLGGSASCKPLDQSNLIWHKW